jgi:hypothetical protein
MNIRKACHYGLDHYFDIHTVFGQRDYEHFIWRCVLFVGYIGRAKSPCRSPLFTKAWVLQQSY